MENYFCGGVYGAEPSRDQDISESERGADGGYERGGGGNFRDRDSLYLRASARRSAVFYQAVLRSADVYVGKPIWLHVDRGAVVYRVRRHLDAFRGGRESAT